MKKTTFGLIMFFLAFAFFFNNYTVVGDGISYFFILESLILDKDLDIANQVERYNDKNIPNSVTEIPPGAALFNTPFYLCSLVLDKFPIFQKEIQMNNRGVLDINIHTAFINLASNFYTLLTLVLMVLILQNLHLKYSFFPIMAVLISTPLLYYAVLVSSQNHAVDTFLIILFVYLFLRLRYKPPKNQFMLGAILALSVSVRYLNAVFFPILFFYYFFLKQREKLKFLVAGFFLFILPLIWYIMMREDVYFFKYLLEHFERQAGSPNEWASIELYPRYFFAILFSPVHGLFLWSPVTILSSIGLYYFYKEKREIAIFFIGMFFSLVFAHSFISAWHGSWSFSTRYLTCLFPVFVVGLSYFIGKYGRLGFYLTALFTAYSLFLMFNHFLSVMDGMTGTPWDMVIAWTSGEMTVKKFLFKIYQISIVNNIIRFL